ncbi:hypothetical protein AD998_06010 [bacterium 336/3]|nr:hypothetical protein AD998_06010 [bacterium 336/3]
MKVFFLIIWIGFVGCQMKNSRPQYSDMLFLKFRCEEDKQEIFNVSVRVPYKEETENRIGYFFDTDQWHSDVELYAPKAQFLTIDSSSVYYQRAIDAEALRKTLSKLAYYDIRRYLDGFLHIFMIDLEESKEKKEYKIVGVLPYSYFDHIDVWHCGNSGETYYGSAF